MPWMWPRPLPLIFMAAPLLLMWAPARAFLGSAAASTQSVLCQTLCRRRRQQGLRCKSSATVGMLEGGSQRKKVIVIAGPTATGKSSIALALCKTLGGEIVSCDSVQVYNDLAIGANKPSDDDMREVRHHLVNIASLDQTFTAGDFVRRAQEAIDDILSRDLVPVVVGGTMMYVQWLIHGVPDAPKKDRAVAEAVAAELLPLKEKGDWEGALQILSAVNETRASSLCRNDWYRLSRSLEVLRGPSDTVQVYTGKRRVLEADYDFRPFFIVGDRERIFRRIDRRCEDMLERGLLMETADLMVKGTLDPASPAGRAIGYRQAIDFLTTESEEWRIETVGSAEANCCSSDARGNAESRFLEFYYGFATKTRQYAGEQMKWFRSSKGKLFSWQAWDLGGHVEEERSARIVRPRGINEPARPQRVARAGDGVGWQDVVKSIAGNFELSPEAFAEGLAGEHQASLRKENEKRAKDMKRYVPTETKASLGDKTILRRLMLQTEELAKRILQEHREPEGAEKGLGEGNTVAGWHSGSR